MHITDGRAFLERSTRRYDMILFALPDSLTLVAGQSSLRLESYLFTTRSMETAKATTSQPGGVFAMYNYYREDVADRSAGRARSTRCTGTRRASTASGGVGQLAVLTDEPSSPARCACDDHLASPAMSPRAAPATDDHPFLYLRTPSDPRRSTW